MKTNFTLLVFFFSLNLIAQDINGSWSTQLEISGMKLPLVFHFEEAEDQFSASMDSPQQQAFELAFSEALRKKDSLFLKMPNMGIEIKAKIKSEEAIEAHFKQGFYSSEIQLKRKRGDDSDGLKRPQTPKPPFTYEEIEVTYTNQKAGIDLAGTLTVPENCESCKAVVLISGSGAQDRNSEIFNHQLFKVVADFLSSNNIAVLRFDERGVGESEGKFTGATTYNFVDDVEAGVSFLLEQNHFQPTQIGLYGHSEGGMVAPLLAKQNENIDFLILIAPPAVPISELMIKQQELVSQTAGLDAATIKFYEQINQEAYALIKASKDLEELTPKLQKFYTQKIEDHPNLGKDGGMTAQEYKQTVMQAYTDPWMYNFLKMDPADYLSALKLPTLAFFGEKDIQVSPKENAERLIELIGENNPSNKISIQPNLNHLMQNATTGSIAEYGMIEETIDQDLLNEILEWLEGI